MRWIVLLGFVIGGCAAGAMTWEDAANYDRSCMHGRREEPLCSDLDAKARGEEPAERPAECCKVCRGSQACGNSCISYDKTCHQPRGCAC
jgi:hypothetical protein